MPMFVTFFAVSLYLGNWFKNLFAMPRPQPSTGGPTENDFGWPSMYALNAVRPPFDGVHVASAQRRGCSLYRAIAPPNSS